MKSLHLLAALAIVTALAVPVFAENNEQPIDRTAAGVGVTFGNAVFIPFKAISAVWGLGMLITGKMADRLCKKDLLFFGMLFQGLALVGFLFAYSMTHFVLLSIILGCGTAMVYPTFLATVAENTHPMDRANSFGVFRLWRDLGYAFGAVLTGIIADVLGISASVLITGLLTIFSAFIIFFRMRCNTGGMLKLTGVVKTYQQ